MTDHQRRSFNVDPEIDRVIKLFPSVPPERGDVVFVNDDRCIVTRCQVTWNGPRWTINSLRVRRTDTTQKIAKEATNGMERRRDA